MRLLVHTRSVPMSMDEDTETEIPQHLKEPYESMTDAHDSVVKALEGKRGARLASHVGEYVSPVIMTGSLDNPE